MRVQMQNKDLMFQIQALNKINQVLLAKAKLFPKKPTDDEIRKLEEDIAESQDKMIESSKEINEQQSRTISQMTNEL